MVTTILHYDMPRTGMIGRSEPVWGRFGQDEELDWERWRRPGSLCNNQLLFPKIFTRTSWGGFQVTPASDQDSFSVTKGFPYYDPLRNGGCCSAE